MQEKEVEEGIVPIDKEDLAASESITIDLLSLNNAHAQELSWLDAASLAHLVSEAFIAWKIGNVDALLLAFDQDAAYDNPNFSWFHSRYESFVYLDRVVVAPSARGRGLARHLYNQLFAFAAQQGHQRVVCEVNLSPPNPASDALHLSMGFVEVGIASIHSGSKTVRYFERVLT